MKINMVESIKTKQMVVFILITLFNIIFATLLYVNAVNVATKATYDEMNSRALFYIEEFDMELSHIQKLQIDFFSDRKLPFLSSSEFDLNDYELRHTLLSIKDRLSAIQGISVLIKDIKLYLTGTEYFIKPSGIRQLSKEHIGELENYIENRRSEISYNDKTIYMVSTGTPKIQTKQHPNITMVIEFDEGQIEKKLASLNNGQESGALLYIPDNGIFIESSNCEYVGEYIVDNIIKKEKNLSNQSFSMTINKEKYLVFAAKSEMFGIYVQYSKVKPIMNKIDRYRNFFYGFLFIAFLLMMLFARYSEKLINKPIRILLNAFKEVENGEFDYILQEGNDEFSYLYDGFNDMVERINRLIKEIYIQKNLTQKAELKQLQTQINPHFLYNSFFALSRRVKRKDFEGAQEFANHLGKYFQYITRSENDNIELYKEVAHARSYAEIQGVRFVNRIKIDFMDLPSKFNSIVVPRLILQPLLENSFEHGLENKEENGILKVSFKDDDQSIYICVEDNGINMTDSTIAELNSILYNVNNDDITGTINIHRRLQIFFKEQAYIIFEKSSLGGLLTKIVINVKKLN